MTGLAGKTVRPTIFVCQSGRVSKPVIKTTDNAPSSGKFGMQGFFHYWEIFHIWEHSQVVLLDEFLITVVAIEWLLSNALTAYPSGQIPYLSGGS